MKKTGLFILLIFVVFGYAKTLQELHQEIRPMLQKNPPQALAKARSGLQSAQEANDAYMKARFLEQIAISNYFLGKYDVALEYLEDAKNILLELEKEETLAIIYNTIGNVYKMVGEYELAMTYYLESLKLKEKADDKTAVAITMNNIGLLYKDIGNYQEALRFLYLALDLYEELQEFDKTAQSMNNLGLVYVHLQEYEKALDFYKSYLSLKKEQKDEDGIARAYNNMGKAYYMAQDYSNAKTYFSKALELRDEKLHPRSTAGTMNNLANVYLEEKNFSKMEELLNESWRIATTIDDKKILKETYYAFYELYSAQNLYEKALEYHILYSELANVFLEKNMPARIENLYEKYRLEKEENLINAKHYEKVLQQEQRKFKFYLAISIFVYVILIVVIFMRKR